MKFSLRNILMAILPSLLLITSACQPTPTPTPANSSLTGTMSEIEGTVDGKLGGAQEFSPISKGSILHVKDQVQTGDDGRARIDLSSGTIIRVVPSSLFTLLSNEESGGGLATKLKLELGRIFIILSGGSMDVQTPSGVASVRGSYMMVEIDPVTQDVIVTCLEGDCSASNPAGAVDFTNGQKVTLFHKDSSGNYRPPFLEDMSDADFQAWLDNNPEAKAIYDALFAKPTATTVPPTATLTPIVDSGPSSTACLNVIYPLDQSSLPFDGPITFMWEPHAGAVKYLVTFSYPDGSKVLFDTNETELTRFMDTLPPGGKYAWNVAALDSDGAQICSTADITFTKPSSLPEDVAPPTKEKEKEKKVCTVGQWDNPNAPCYCDSSKEVLPQYCYSGGN